MLWALPSGKRSHSIEKPKKSRSAITAGLQAVKITLKGVKKVSKKLPRFQAEYMPIETPITKLIKRASPARYIVHMAAYFKFTMVG